jgi:glutamate/aspartate transport system substrate-binding protein
MPSFITRILILSFCLFSAACAKADELGTTLQRIKNSGTINIAYRESMPPFSFDNEARQPIGFSIDLCGPVVQAVKRKLGIAELKVNYKSVSVEESIALLQSGGADIDCGSTARTPEREAKVGFSNPAYLSEYRWLVFRKPPVQDEKRSRRRRPEIRLPVSAEDLRGKTIVLTEEAKTSAAILNLSDDKSLGISLLYGKDPAECLSLLQKGQAAALLEKDRVLFALKFDASTPEAFFFLEDGYLNVPEGMMLRKGDNAFKRLVDTALATAIKSGEYTKAYEKWFENPIPPKGVNLGLPMSPRLKAYLKEVSSSPAG